MMLFGIFAILIANLYLQHYVLSTPLVYMIM
jgi:disulfide bond formation protein DsbB